MTANSSLAQDLIFEFSHATIANQDDEISHQLGRLAALGFRFSLDQVNSLNLDYGTLAEQHFKYIKIDAETMLREVPQPTTDIVLHDFKKSARTPGDRPGGGEDRNRRRPALYPRFPRRFRTGLLVRRAQEFNRRLIRTCRGSSGSAPRLRRCPIPPGR